jgi:hypothetical protein
MNPSPTAFALAAWIKTWMPRLVIGGFVVIYFIHFAGILSYSVNIPYGDEWTMVFRQWKPEPFSLWWLVRPHNEHQILTTKAFVALQYYLNGWNHQTNLILNFGIYGITLIWLIMLAKRLAPSMPVWIIVAFSVFLLSPIDWMNHFIGLQVCFHFWLLFFLIGLFFLFDSQQTWLRLIVASLALILSLYSLATGLVSGLILLVAFGTFKISRARSAGNLQTRKRELLQFVMVTVSLGGAIALWYAVYRNYPTRFSLALPNELGFWRVFLNLVSLGFGVDSFSTRLGAVCLLIVLAPIAWQVYRKRGSLSTTQWASYAGVAAILGVLAFVTMGRAPMGLGWAKVSRYAEIGMPLIVLSALNWSDALQTRKQARALALVVFWAFCLMTFWDNRSFDAYRRLSGVEKSGVACARAYYEKQGDGRCAHIAAPFDPIFLDRGRQLNASYYQEISAQIQSEKPRE